MLEYTMDPMVKGAVRVYVEGDRGNMSWATMDMDGNIVRECKRGAYLCPGLTDAEIAEARERIATIQRKPVDGDCYIRFNDLPRGGKSRNHASGMTEAGVSCYEARWDILRGCFRRTGSGLEGAALVYLLQGAPIYLIQGEVVGTGSDGEPLLGSARVIGTLAFDREKDGYVLVKEA